MKNVKVLKELARLRQQQKGLLLPEAVVTAAKPKTSPLHRYFEWDDTEAAHQHRLWQARQLISVCVEIIPNSLEPVSVGVVMPSYTSLSTDRANGGGYRATVEVLSDAEMYAQALADALADLNTFQRRYAHLRELGQVFEAINNVKKTRAA